MSTHSIFHVDIRAHLRDAEYIFDFEGRKFRLIRGTDDELDKISTITDGSAQEIDRVGEVVFRLCDCLNWEWYGAGVQFRSGGGGAGCKDDARLERLLVASFHARRLRGSLVELKYLPNVPTREGRIALALMNEARCTQSPFLAFINYWKILELPRPGLSNKGAPEKRAITWIDKLPRNAVYIPPTLEATLKNNPSLGQYLYSKCRNAIAHVTRPDAMLPNRPEDVNRVTAASDVVYELAKKFTEEELQVTRHFIPVKVLKGRFQVPNATGR